MPIKHSNLNTRCYLTGLWALQVPDVNVITSEQEGGKGTWQGGRLVVGVDGGMT